MSILLLREHVPPIKPILLPQRPAHPAAMLLKEANNRTSAEPLPAGESARVMLAAPPAEHADQSPAKTEGGQASGSTSAAIDIEGIKRSIRKEPGGMGDQHPSGKNNPALMAQKPESPLSQAILPKCDDKYKPQVGAVSFDGLLKLPFLVKNAVTQTGCKF